MGATIDMRDISCDPELIEHFIDGDDVCAGCGICCRGVRGLLVTPAELEQTPLMKPFVSSFDGDFYLVDLPDQCPYQAEDGRCGAFETRPFDCSLYPVSVIEVRRAPGRRAAHVTWMWGGHHCPMREVFVRRGASAEQMARLHEWLACALQTDEIVVSEVSPTYHLRQAGRALLQSQSGLRRLRRGIRRLAGR
jgi:Fe-S-cluster containining protein